MTGVLIFSLASAQTIDKKASVVTFKAENIKINTVDGTIKGMQGDVRFNKDKPEAAKFDVTVNVNTIKTGINKRDKDLKKENFFHTKKYPHIRFKSDKVEKSGEDYQTTGTLTMKGVSKKVTIPFSVNTQGSSTVLTGHITLNRKDYNIGEDTGTFMIGEEIEITIKCLLK